MLESLTTTGFGSQPLESPLTQLWAILLMLLGLLLIAGLLTALIHRWYRPWLDRLPPVRAPRRLHGHLLIVGAGPVGRYVAQACQRSRIPHLLLDPDEKRLQRAWQAGFQAITGDPSSQQVLSRARLAQARALILTERDGANLRLLLQARAQECLPPCYATQEELPPALLKRAGAAGVVSTKRRLGHRLGHLAVAPYASAIAALHGQIEGLRWSSLPVLPGSIQALSELQGALVLGVITRGLFLPAPQVTSELRPGDLVILGHRGDLGLQGLRPLALPRRGPVLILGAGHVGLAAAACLKAQGSPVWLLDRRPPPPGLLVERFTQGDATSAIDLRQAGAATAAAVLIALPEDEAALVAAMTLRGLGQGRLIGRVNELDAIAPLYLAGAEAVVALPEVGGAALARLAIPSGVPLPTLGELIVRTVPVEPEWVGRRAAELGLGDLVLLAVRRADGRVELGPEAGAPLEVGDEIQLFGSAGGARARS